MSHNYRRLKSWQAATGTNRLTFADFRVPSKRRMFNSGSTLPDRFHIDGEDTFQRRRYIQANNSRICAASLRRKTCGKFQPRDRVHRVVLALSATESYTSRADVHVLYVGENGGLMAYLAYGRKLPIRVRALARDSEGEVMMSGGRQLGVALPPPAATA